MTGGRNQKQRVFIKKGPGKGRFRISSGTGGKSPTNDVCGNCLQDEKGWRHEL
jgi:hypothetical protein